MLVLVPKTALPALWAKHPASIRTFCSGLFQRKAFQALTVQVLPIYRKMTCVFSPPARDLTRPPAFTMPTRHWPRQVNYTRHSPSSFPWRSDPTLCTGSVYVTMLPLDPKIFGSLPQVITLPIYCSALSLAPCCYFASTPMNGEP